MSIRGILISAIYHKSLKLGKDTLEAEAAVTLMTADTAGVNRLVSLSYNSWAQVLEISAGVAILGAFVGAATLFTIIPIISKHVPHQINCRLAYTDKPCSNHCLVCTCCKQTDVDVHNLE